MTTDEGRRQRFSERREGAIWKLETGNWNRRQFVFILIWALFGIDGTTSLDTDFHYLLDDDLTQYASCDGERRTGAASCCRLPSECLESLVAIAMNELVLCVSVLAERRKERKALK